MKTAPIQKRLAGYFRTVLARLGAGKAYSICFDTLARRLDVSRRTVERGVAALRTSPAFLFKTLRVGRSFAVQVSDRHPSNKGVFSPTERKKETRAVARLSAFKPRTKAIIGLAACIARNDLQGLHWDNCKVRFQFPHAFLYAFRALNEGHARVAISGAYDLALHQRHKDATDHDLNNGANLTRWEPSSTVSLAAERLRTDGRTAAERWAEFFGVGAVAPAGWQANQIPA
jgi:hypothetical protein